MRQGILVLVALVSLAGCVSDPTAQQATPRPAPTIAPFFSGVPDSAPTIVLPTPLPDTLQAPEDPPLSDAAALQATAQRDSSDRVVAEVAIYDEQLDPNWSLDESWGIRINPRSLSFSSSGRVALEAVPVEAFAGVLLINSPESTRIYPRDDVLGIRFSVSGGERYLQPESLIVKVMGSNRYPYFVGDDQSVRIDYDPSNPYVFDEVGLSRLGLRRDLEPGEWAEVELWLDGYDLAGYTYVTAINVMNAPSFMTPFYIDNIRLLVRRP
jgi:hypothetical protein